MSNKARLSDSGFTPRGGVDFDNLIERCDDRDQGSDSAELDLNSPPETRKEKRVPKRIAQF